MPLTFYPKHTHTHTYAYTHTDTLTSSLFRPAPLLTPCLSCTFYFRSGQPQPKNIHLPFAIRYFPRASSVAYIPISISIIAGELPASSGARESRCGLQMLFSWDTSASRYFQLVALIRMSRRLERSRVIYRSTFFSLSLFLLPPSALPQPPFVAVILSPSASFRLVPAAFQHPASSATHTPDPQEPLDCEFP